MNEESDLRTQPMSAGSTLAVLTSGGDAPGMNVAIRTVTKIALARGFRVLGIRHGYKGLLDGDTVELQHRDVDQIVRFTWGRNRKVDLVEFMLTPELAIEGRVVQPIAALTFESFIYCAQTLAAFTDRLEYVIQQPDVY